MLDNRLSWKTPAIVPNILCTHWYHPTYPRSNSNFHNPNHLFYPKHPTPNAKPLVPLTNRQSSPPSSPPPLHPILPLPLPSSHARNPQLHIPHNPINTPLIHIPQYTPLLTPTILPTPQLPHLQRLNLYSLLPLLFFRR